MQQFIDMAVSQLGIGADDAKTATGGLLSVVKDQLSGSEFSAIESALPGAGDLISQFTGGESSGGGGLLGMAKSLLGGGGGALGGAAAIAGILSKTNLDASQLGGFGDLLMNFLKENADDAIGSKLSSFLPSLLGDAAA